MLRDLEQKQRVRFRNDSGETIPAFGVIRITGVTIVDGQTVLKAEKSTENGSRYLHYVNNFLPTRPDRFGQCIVPSGPVYAKYDENDGTPQFGEEWGPIDDSWLLYKEIGGFTVLGEVVDDRVMVIRTPSACDAQNAVMQLAVIGSPTGGTFDIDLRVGNSIETLTFNYNDDASAVKTALTAHPNIGSNDVSVTDGPFPNATIQIQFLGDLANTNIALPAADWSDLTGGSGVAVIPSTSQLGIA